MPSVSPRSAWPALRPSVREHTRQLPLHLSVRVRPDQRRPRLHRSEFRGHPVLFGECLRWLRPCSCTSHLWPFAFRHWRVWKPDAQLHSRPAVCEHLRRFPVCDGGVSSLEKRHVHQNIVHVRVLTELFLLNLPLSCSLLSYLLCPVCVSISPHKPLVCTIWKFANLTIYFKGKQSEFPVCGSLFTVSAVLGK